MAVPSPSTERKRALRHKARALRAEFVAGAAAPWAPPDFAFPRIPDGPVAAYRPMADEADPAPLAQRLGNCRDGLAYPRIDEDGQMRFYRASEAGFVRDRLGIEVPADDAVAIVPSLVLVPLLAFDRSGTRLGQGGGHYDRALAALAAAGHRPMLVGVAWSVQEFARLPRDRWDIALDAVITEREWIAPR